jgi:hypothetical protein
MKCPNPTCTSTFVSYEQFTNHLQSSDKHKDDIHFKNNTNIHLKMNHIKFIRLIKEYFTRVAADGDDLSKYLNITCCLSDIRDWLQLFSTSEDYLLRGLKIYDTYLALDAPQKVTCNGIENQVEKLAILKSFHSSIDKSFYTEAELEKLKFLRRVNLPKSWWRFIRGKPAKQYDEWTDEHILSPMIYRYIQYKLSILLFEYLLEEYKNNNGFWISPEGKMLEEWFTLDEKIKHKELYKNYKEQRIQQIKAWARDYKKKEDKIAKTAETSIDRLRKLICDDLVERYYVKLIEDKVTAVSAKEQKHHERASALIHEAICWVEEELSDEIYNIYMTIFLKNALSGGRRERKPLLIYGGFEAEEKKKDETVYMKIKNEGADLFKSIF